MKKDLALLSELEDLNDTQIMAYLNFMFISTVTNMIEAKDELSVYRLQGEARVLKRLIREIETATDEKIRLRAMENKIDPNHRF